MIKLNLSKLKKLSEIGYASNLFKTFNEQYEKVVNKYISDKVKTKIEKQLEKSQQKLQDAKVTELQNVITEKLNSTDPDVSIPSTKIDTLKSALKRLGVDAIVGVDGEVITKSEDILFVDNRIIIAGDLAEIVKGIAYEQVINSVRASLTPTQRNMILQQYNKVVGIDGTVQDALTALLFDKQFYTKILLLSSERKYGNEAIQLLTTIDQVVKSSTIQQLDNGELTTNAYRTLINKVYATMKAGLIHYATQYVLLDLDKISNEVLPVTIKNEIRNNKNVIFTTVVNDAKRNAKNKVLIEGDIKRFMFYLSKFSDILTEERKK